MINRFFLSIVFVLFSIYLIAQKDNDSITNLNEVLIKTQRIPLTFSKSSHTISIISANEIMNMSATSLDEVLQNITSVDIRRRGVQGTQSDLYIRGGNFNQTLLLIDGIAMNDLQTGHHTMNSIVSLDNIARIEVIKGAASRIYGENAMSGAINIITKDPLNNTANISLNIASYDTYGIDISFQQIKENVGMLFQINRLQSQGYRYNTDFENINSFLKVKWNKNELISSYSQRKFGANGFYANPNFKDQYEETQTHFIAVKNTFKDNVKKINTNLYWRRNQDMYLFLRDNPSYYRNLHISDRIGLSVNSTINNDFGITGVGIDLNQGFLKSNNLNDHNRFTSTFFIEHRFQLLNDKFDVKPGIALSNYSDFGFYYYPGVDLGYRISKQLKLYANTGYTFRNPTYTNLYYHSYTEIGNENLKPEKALNYETGIYFNKNNSNINISGFYRQATDFIDYVKINKDDKWEAHNVGVINTSGVEMNYKYRVQFGKYFQKFDLGYTFLNQEYNNPDFNFSRYALNAYRHQFSTRISSQFFSFLKQSVSYRYHKRYENQDYHLLDVVLNTNLKNWKLGIQVNNILNTEYYEANLVPMPKANFGLNIKYGL